MVLSKKGNPTQQSPFYFFQIRKGYWEELNEEKVAFCFYSKIHIWIGEENTKNTTILFDPANFFFSKLQWYISWREQNYSVKICNLRQTDSQKNIH